MPTLSTTELTKLSHTLARALSVDAVNQLGRDTGQAKRLRTVTPHRLFLALVSTLGSGRVESLADLLRAFNHQNGVEVAYKAFYNRFARVGFATFMVQESAALTEYAVATHYPGPSEPVDVQDFYGAGSTRAWRRSSAWRYSGLAQRDDGVAVREPRCGLNADG